MKILYTAAVTSTGARHGRVESSDGNLNLLLAPPPEMGGNGGATNPEQLFGGGYAACFGGAMEYLARQRKINLGDVQVAAKVGIGPTDSGIGFGLAVELNVSASALSQSDLEQLTREAHQVCPYSNATRGNIEVRLMANGKPL
jgi:Ohr subfamily peroxiredoxin